MGGKTFRRQDINDAIKAKRVDILDEKFQNVNFFTAKFQMLYLFERR
jgi:hypothetical protein